MGESGIRVNNQDSLKTYLLAVPKNFIHRVPILGAVNKTNAWAFFFTSYPVNITHQHTEKKHALPFARSPNNVEVIFPLLLGKRTLPITANA
jgi:hypothetical protein